MKKQTAAPAARQVGDSTPEHAKARYEPRYSNSWAAVIGINDYRHLDRPLTYAVADAESVANLLITQLGFHKENVFVILDPPPQHKARTYQAFSRNATKAKVEELLLTVLPDKAQIDDRVFVFFAGHGDRRPLSNRDVKGYLMPADARPGAWHQWIAIDNILDNGLYASKHVFFVLDACYSGLAATRSPETKARYHLDLLTHRARQVLTAGMNDQVVSDIGGDGHSIFTHYLLQGLGGKAKQPDSGAVTAFDLMRYVRTHVGRDTHSAQTPDEGTLLGHGGGDFVFVLPKKTTISLRSYKVSVGDQGGMAPEIAPAFAVIRAMQLSLANQAHYSGLRLDPKALYLRTKQHDELSGDGTTLSALVYCAERFGVPDYKKRIWRGTFFRLASFDEIPEHLAQLRPVVAAIDVYENWFSGPGKSGDIQLPEGEFRNKITVVLDWYAADTNTIGFSVSWGSQNWGEKGHGYMREDVWRRLLSVDQLWSVYVPIQQEEELQIVQRGTKVR